MYGKYLPHNNSASGATIHMVWHHTPHYSVWQIPPQGMMCAFVIINILCMASSPKMSANPYFPNTMYGKFSKMIC